MERVHYERSGPVAIVQLDDGKANAMQQEWCVQLGAALDRAEEEGARCVLLRGRPGFFSGGLDLKVLPGLEPEALQRETGAFMEAMRRVFLLPIPVVAASEGHAIAGGMMLFLAADSRIVVDGDEAQYGLNEARTGIPLLGGTLGICEYSIPPAHHTEMILHGQLLSARETFERQITQRLVGSPAALRTESLEVARDLATLDPEAYRVNKQLMRGAAYAGAVERASALADAVPVRNVFSGLAR